MFDTYRTVVQPGPSHISVTEKRAPTDESVRLLKEFEAEAKNKVLNAVSVKNTVFDGVLHHTHDLHSDKFRFACVFKLNGERMTASFEINTEEANKEKVAIGIRDAIAAQIANSIATELMRSVPRLGF